MTVQYRLVVAKGDERIDGPDDADVVLAVGPNDLADGAAVAFMRGKLKAVGDTGAVLAALGSGAADAAFAKLSA